MKETVTVLAQHVCNARGVVFSRWKKTTIRLPFIRVRRIVSGNGPAISEIPRASCASTSPRTCTIIRGDVRVYVIGGKGDVYKRGNENFQIYENRKAGKFRGCYRGVVVRAFKNIRAEGNESTIYEADSRALTSLFHCHSPASQIYRRPVHFSVSRAATKCPR